MSVSCVLYCGYFNPVVQKFGDSYYVYPDRVERYGRTTAETRVNGNVITDGKYSFEPKSVGIHYLDIEYSLWGQYGLQTLNFRKGLLVK